MNLLAILQFHQALSGAGRKEVAISYRENPESAQLLICTRVPRGCNRFWSVNAGWRGFGLLRGKWEAREVGWNVGRGEDPPAGAWNMTRLRTGLRSECVMVEKQQKAQRNEEADRGRLGILVSQTHPLKSMESKCCAICSSLRPPDSGDMHWPAVPVRFRLHRAKQVRPHG